MDTILCVKCGKEYEGELCERCLKGTNSMKQSCETCLCPACLEDNNLE